MVTAPPGPEGETRCRDAIRKVFPAELHEEAFITLHSENGKETPGRVGVNSDKVKSKDHGCMQINDHWHYGRPGSVWKSGQFNSIYDAEYNVRVALNIYNRNGKTWAPWYGPCTKGKEKLPLARCGR